MPESLPEGRAGRRIAIPLVRVGVALALGLGVPICGRTQTPPPRDLTQFSLEDLMNVEVMSVSKKEQKVAKTGAAIFVITPGRHPPFGGDQYSRPPAHGAGRRCGANGPQ